MQIIITLIIINININTIINTIAIKPFNKNLAIKIIFYINFISKNLKLATKLKQKFTNIAINIIIKKAELKQKFINIGIAIISQKINLKTKYINPTNIIKTKT